MVKPSALTFTPKYAEGATGVAGLILRLNDRPLAGVTVSIGTKVTTTDDKGRFELTEIPAGRQVMVVDGANAGQNGRRYAEFTYGIDIVAGQVTELTHAVYLPQVRAKDWINVSIPTRVETIVTHPELPGFEIRIPKGAVIRDRHGKIINRLAVVPVPVDRAPFPLPKDFPIYFMLQPSGATVQGLDPRNARGIQVHYPNHTKQAPGTSVRYWLYDPYQKGWTVYGSAKVSRDGSRIDPDAGTYLPQNLLGGYTVDTEKGWPDPLPGGCETESGGTQNTSERGDPVDCASGVFFHKTTDVVLNDVTPLALRRIHRTGDPHFRSFGIGAMHDFDMYLHSKPSSGQASGH